MYEYEFDNANLEKVRKACEKFNIKYETPCDFGIERIHFVSPITQANVSVIFGRGTYGFECGLLESMPPTDAPDCLDDVEGYLTAEEVIKAFIH